MLDRLQIASTKVKTIVYNATKISKGIPRYNKLSLWDIQIVLVDCLVVLFDTLQLYVHISVT